MTDSSNVRLSDLVKNFKNRSGLSYAKIAKAANLHVSTIQNWVREMSRKPRQWQDLVQFGLAINLTRSEMEQILAAADHPTITEIKRLNVDLHLLEVWEAPKQSIFLPRAKTSHFIGREKELSTLADLLQSGDRLAVIQGMGGVGKSTLAFQVIRQIQDRFPDGVLWGDFVELNAEEVIENWGIALGIDFPDRLSSAGKAARFMGELAQKRMLIVIDDVRSIQSVRKLLPSRLSGCSVLITTRNREVAIGLVTHPKQIILLSPLTQESSFELINSILGPSAVQRDLYLYEEVCQLLGNLPLALTIFAKRRMLSALSLRDAVLQLRTIKTRLSRLAIADEAVQIAFEQSWQELTEEDQIAFEQLSIFSGHSFSIEAFHTIFRYTPSEAANLINRLGMLFLVEPANDASSRYKQHPLIAAWSFEKAAGKYNSAHQSFSSFYLEYLKTHQTSWDKLLAEWPNTMLALDRAIEGNHTSIYKPFVMILQPIWYRRGYFQDAFIRYREMIRHESLESDLELNRFASLHGGIAATFLSDFQTAKRYLNRSLDLPGVVSTESDVQTGDAFFHLGMIAKNEQNRESATTHLRKAWNSYQDSPDPTKQANTLYQLADVYYFQGDFSEAEKIGRDALAIYRQVKSNIGILDTLMFIATIYQEQKRFEDSLAIIEEAKPFIPDIIDPSGLGSFYYTAGNLNRHLKNFSEAESQLKLGLDYFSKSGDLTSQANILNVLARLAFDSSDGDNRPILSGIETAKSSINLCQEIGYTLGEVAAGLTLGKLHKLAGNLEGARETWKRALQLAKEIENSYFENLLFEELKE